MELMKERCTVKIIFKNGMTVQQSFAHTAKAVEGIINTSIKQKRPCAIMMCSPDGSEPAASYIDFSEILVLSIIPLPAEPEKKATGIIDAAGQVVEPEEKKSNLIL